MESDKLFVKGRVEGDLAGYRYRSSFFNLPALLQPDYLPSHRWIEGWFEPGIDFVFRPHKKLEIYGGASLGLSGSWGIDPYGTEDVGETKFENKFVGIRTTNPESSWNIDISTGQQNYEAGTGMLLSLGADNGSESGAVNLMPRTAWSHATLARFSYKGVRLEGFYLEPNAFPESDTFDRLIGGLGEYRWGEESRVGISYVKVLRSTLDYPAAKQPPAIESGRDEMYAVDAFAIIEGSAIGLGSSFFRAELAIERNPRIDMKAYAVYGAAGYNFEKARFAPQLSLEFALFSGDDRGTSTYERFDPLFYGTSTVDWFFGANSCNALFNANTIQLRSGLDLSVSEKDSLTFQHVHSRAQKLLSPLQIGELEREVIIDGRVTIVNGVTAHHLADEIYAEWTRTVMKGLDISLWGSAIKPGSGITTIPLINAKNWLGFGVSVDFTF